MKKVKKATYQQWDTSKKIQYLEQAIKEGILPDTPKGRMYIKALKEIQ